MRNNTYTPDQEITPPYEDDRYVDCIVCNGTGDAIDWENEDEDDPLSTPLIKCPKCKGEGKIESDEND